jgi:hypothetical protein
MEPFIRLEGVGNTVSEFKIKRFPTILRVHFIRTTREFIQKE